MVCASCVLPGLFGELASGGGGAGQFVAFATNYLILQLGDCDAGWAHRLGFREYNWRWMLGLETLPAVLYIVGLFFVPPSPRWLLMKGRDEEALPIMQMAVGEVAAKQELAEIHQNMGASPDQDKGSVKELFTPARRLVITIGGGDLCARARRLGGRGRATRRAR